MLPYAYGKAQLTVFYDLLKTANPSLPFDPAQNTYIGVPVSITPVSPSVSDTSIKVNGISPNYFGNKAVSYRRINIGNMFKNIVVKLTDYVSGSVLPIATALASINSAYGLALTTADVALTQLSAGNNAVTITATSICYTGTFTVNWTKGKPDIGTVLTGNSFAGRLFPGGNSFAVGRKPQGQYLEYDLNCTSLKGNFANLTTGTMTAGNSDHEAIVNFLIANGSSMFNDTSHTNSGGLMGLAFAKYTLVNGTQNMNVPEANYQSSTYNAVFVITALASSWFQGQLLLHYNSN